jgi:hypothetical protein
MDLIYQTATLIKKGGLDESSPYRKQMGFIYQTRHQVNK